jgi:hypothetical protein
MDGTLALDRDHDNTLGEHDEFVIHGPTWTRRMRADPHSRSLAAELINRWGWHSKPNPLGWLDVSTPWRPEVLQ